jgi:hypothetical protein
MVLWPMTRSNFRQEPRQHEADHMGFLGLLKPISLGLFLPDRDSGCLSYSRASAWNTALLSLGSATDFGMDMQWLFKSWNNSSSVSTKCTGCYYKVLSSKCGGSSKNRTQSIRLWILLRGRILLKMMVWRDRTEPGEYCEPALFKC